MSTVNVQEVASLLKFNVADRGGLNAYYNKNADANYRVAFISLWKTIQELGDESKGLTVDVKLDKDSPATKYNLRAIIGVNSTRYINAMPSSVFNVPPDIAALLSEFDEASDQARAKSKAYKTEHANVNDSEF